LEQPGVDFMKAITIRGIDPELAEKLKQAAALRGKSTNRLILERIRKEIGLEKEKKYSRRYNDLDELFGRSSEDEFRRISNKIEEESQIEQMEVSAAEFRANCFKILDEVETTHKEVVITKRGRPVARLVYFAQQKDKDPLLGSMEGLVETIGDLTEPVIEHQAWELD